MKTRPNPASILRGSKLSGPATERFLASRLPSRFPPAKNGREPAFAIPVFSDEVPIDGPSGKYRFLVTFEKGVAASGGESEFYVTDPADMPAVESDVALWGNDPELLNWLKEHGVKVHPYRPGKSYCPPGDPRLLCARRRRPCRSMARSGHANCRRIDGSFPYAGCLQKGRQPVGLAAAYGKRSDGNESANIRFPRST